jgi:hypothetical protein
MILLDTTDKSLEIVLAGAVATNQLPFIASFADHDATSFTPGANDGVTNSTTPVAAVAAPPAGAQRQVKFLSVVNLDTAAVEVTIQLNNNSTIREIFVVTLAVDEQFVYVDGAGFIVYTNSGEQKTTVA